MALNKYGSAANMGFGTEDVSGFDIVESITSESSYNNEVVVKDNNGDTTGLILSDERSTITVSGIASSAPASLGDTSGSDPTGVAGSGLMICTGVRANWSNEDFQKYETTYTVYAGITGGGGDSSSSPP